MQVLNFSWDKFFVVNVQPAKTAKFLNLENFRLYDTCKCVEKREWWHTHVHVYEGNAYIFIIGTDSLSLDGVEVLEWASGEADHQVKMRS